MKQGAAKEPFLDFVRPRMISNLSSGIGIPIGKDGWWNHCTWPDGSPVTLLTYERLGEMIREDCGKAIEEMAHRLAERLSQTLEEIIKQEQK